MTGEKKKEGRKASRWNVLNEAQNYKEIYSYVSFSDHHNVSWVKGFRVVYFWRITCLDFSNCLWEEPGTTHLLTPLCNQREGEYIWDWWNRTWGYHMSEVFIGIPSWDYISLPVYPSKLRRVPFLPSTPAWSVSPSRPFNSHTAWWGCDS